MYYLCQHFGVVVGAVSGVLAAGGKRIDLFGVVVLGLVTALGGGTLRDAVLGPDPALGTSAVFWIRDANYVATASVASVAMEQIKGVKQIKGVRSKSKGSGLIDSCVGTC